MRRRIKLAGGVFGAVLLLYIVVVALFYFFQETFIFQGTALPREHVYKFDQKFEEHFIPTEDGETINALLFQSQNDSSKGLVLYFHGNAGDLQRWGEYAVDFTKLGYDILMMDYRGYGKSTGQPTEKNLYQDSQIVFEWAKNNISYTKLVIVGRSLGSAVATNLAANATPDLLILETPFDELSSVLYSMPSRFKFPNNVNLPKVKCRKLIIHGTQDGVVPLSSAEKLKPLLDENDLFVVIKDGNHNNLREFRKYHEVLRDVLE
jgi:uncharacterized protein